MKKIQKNFLEAFIEEISTNKIRIKEVPVVSVLLSPGDIISFDYVDLEYTLSNRLALVVSTRFAPNGRRVTSRGNRVVCVFDITGKDFYDIRIITNLLYRNKRRCQYHKMPKSLFALMGRDNFRTFIIKSIADLKKLQIDKNV